MLSSPPFREIPPDTPHLKLACLPDCAQQLLAQAGELGGLDLTPGGALNRYRIQRGSFPLLLRRAGKQALKTRPGTGEFEQESFEVLNWSRQDFSIFAKIYSVTFETKFSVEKTMPIFPIAGIDQIVRLI